MTYISETFVAIIIGGDRGTLVLKINACPSVPGKKRLLPYRVIHEGMPAGCFKPRNNASRKVQSWLPKSYTLSFMQPLSKTGSASENALPTTAAGSDLRLYPGRSQLKPSGQLPGTRV